MIAIKEEPEGSNGIITNSGLPPSTPGETASFGRPLNGPLIEASTGRYTAYLAGGGLHGPA
jgi:hypothetical protein